MSTNTSERDVAPTHTQTTLLARWRRSDSKPERLRTHKEVLRLLLAAIKMFFFPSPWRHRGAMRPETCSMPSFIPSFSEIKFNAPSISFMRIEMDKATTVRACLESRTSPQRWVGKRKTSERNNKIAFLCVLNGARGFFLASSSPHPENPSMSMENNGWWRITPMPACLLPTFSPLRWKNNKKSILRRGKWGKKKVFALMPKASAYFHVSWDNSRGSSCAREKQFRQKHIFFLVYRFVWCVTRLIAKDAYTWRCRGS